MSVAVAVMATGVLRPVASAVRSLAVMTGAVRSPMVTVMSLVELLPLASVAFTVTVVSPRAKPSASSGSVPTL